MPGLETTLDKLFAARRQWESLMGGAASKETRPDDRLIEVPSFGPNPGALRMLMYLPQGLPPGAPLVVVLHGCTQNAGGYDLGSGWSTLADRAGFALLFPEQLRANNHNLCFNWFQPEDVQRDHGEVGSIARMVTWMLETLHLDHRRVFVTGLSAGGAMTAAMLATYPEMFAAGAIIAGLPYGAAANVQEAVDRMFHGHLLTGPEWGDKVRRAAPPGARFPHVAIWHGSADRTVVPANGSEGVKQWLDVHRLGADAMIEDTVDGCSRRVWRGSDGAPLVTSIVVPGLGHGTPIDPASSDPARAVGAAMPHILDAGVSSTLHIARAWGLVDAVRPGAGRKTATGSRPEALDIVSRVLRSVGLSSRQ